ncbi:hypothetical protein GOP47_0011846 [Adiantum capillus-veneris]|uniref:Uncharacterized protein n=1 Tax=Adiantum capillus-veneris TaxID=13818 RepID=A0A9D4UUU6_ADICA|nr:hypothetical protein GOP47_0011846 [Adiantum capillus-veneris]
MDEANTANEEVPPVVRRALNPYAEEYIPLRELERRRRAELEDSALQNLLRSLDPSAPYYIQFGSMPPEYPTPLQAQYWPEYPTPLQAQYVPPHSSSTPPAPQPGFPYYNIVPANTLAAPPATPLGPYPVAAPQYIQCPLPFVPGHYAVAPTRPFPVPMPPPAPYNYVQYYGPPPQLPFPQQFQPMQYHPPLYLPPSPSPPPAAPE